MKTNKRKVRKCLQSVEKHSCRFDLANGKYLSIFLGGFTRGQLNNEGGGELHEIKRSQDKTEIDKEQDKE